MKIASIFRLYVTLFALLFLNSNFVSWENNKIKVELSLLDTSTLSSKKVELLVRVINFSGNSIRVPDIVFWGLKNDPYADFILEVEKKGTLKRFTHFDIPDNYNPTYREIVLREVNDKDTLKESFNIAFFYSHRFPKGVYRTRVLYKISRYNSSADIYSNWMEFVIK